MADEWVEVTPGSSVNTGSTTNGGSLFNVGGAIEIVSSEEWQDILAWEQSIRDAADFTEQRELWLAERPRRDDENMSEYGQRMLLELGQITENENYTALATPIIEDLAQFREDVASLPDEFWDDLNNNRNSGAPTVIDDSAYSPMEGRYYPPPAGDDIDEADEDAVVRDSNENYQSVGDALDGLDFESVEDRFLENRHFSPVTDTWEEIFDGAHQPYKRVVNGWNQKLRSPSEDLSQLTPFCELYAIFDDNDLIYQEEGTNYTAIRDRLYNVTFYGVGDNEPPLPEGISKNCKIAKIAGENISQISPDSIRGGIDEEKNPYSSFKGLPGISDLGVSRGSAAAQNVKYDLTLTMPNPEIINEKFEYSKLMLMNSAFLLIYGWNIRDTSFDAGYYPPKILKNLPMNNITVGNGLGGFWSSTVISLYNFEFNFDSVGHLVGKLKFLNNAGIFLGTIQVEAVGGAMDEAISTPSQSVLDRVNNNQNFIWENGVPWSSNDGNDALAKESSDSAVKASVIREYFNNDRAGWNEAYEKHMAPEGITAEKADGLREGISKLNDLGENFLRLYRMAILNRLFNKDRADDLSTEQEKMMEELKSNGITSRGKDKNIGNFWGLGDLTQDIEAGRTYHGGTEEDKLIDNYYGTQIINAWNNFFLLRFEGENNPMNKGTRSFVDGRGENHSRDDGQVIQMQLLPEDGDALTLINAGTGFGEFFIQAGSLGEWDNLPGVFRLSFVNRLYSRGYLVPKIYEDLMTSTSDAMEADQYIKNMPPFGTVLQGKIIRNFKEEKNINYNNFYGPNAIISREVRNLMERTSVISVPVPIHEDDSAILTIETRTYTEIMRDAPGEVIFSLEILNPETGISLDSTPRNLYKIKFHTTSVLTSLSTVNDEMRRLVADMTKDFDDNVGIAISGDDGGEFLFRDALQDSLFTGDLNLLGRFVQWKYAILKNGYIVKQYRESADMTFTDVQPPTLVERSEGGVVMGVDFLLELLPKNIISDLGALNEDGSPVTYAQMAESHLESLRLAAGRVTGGPDNPAAVGQEAAEEAWIEVTNAQVEEIQEWQEDAAGAIYRFLNLTFLVNLENVLLNATQGTAIQIQEDLNTANQDEVSIQDETGDSIYKIYRQPVYFFLGSVLESLREATGNKIKFRYSKIPHRKEGEPFHISIPETTGNSIQNSYDAQIARLTQDLLRLGGALPPGARAQTIEMIPQAEADVDAEELEKRQNDWDTGLVDYIKHRGQDFATLGYNDLGLRSNLFSKPRPPNQAENSMLLMNAEAQQGGVYLNYTSSDNINYPARVRSPNFYWNIATDSNWTTAYDAEKTRGADDQFDREKINIRAPWIFRLGNQDNYYRGPRGLYRAGISRPANLGWPDFWPAFKDWKDEYAGFMRIWRPEDLSQAFIAALANEIYTRVPMNNAVDVVGNGGEPKLKTPNRNAGGYPSFYTDSFGEGSIATIQLVDVAGGQEYQFTRELPPMPDWGLQEAFTNDASIMSYNAIYGAFMPERVNNTDEVLRQLTSWLDWWPHEDLSSHQEYQGVVDAFPGLVQSKHRSISGGNPNDIQSSTNPETGITSTAQDQAAINGWHLIQWPIGGSGNKFWVKGHVVQDFIYYEGMRPSVLMPNPRAQEAPDIASSRHTQINILKQRILEAQTKKEAADLKTQFTTLGINTTFELPVYIDTIRQFLKSEPNAPLHNLMKKVVGAVRETIPAIQLSMRPDPSDSTYIDIFPSNLNYDGIIQEVFTEIDVNRKSGTIVTGPEGDILTAQANINYGDLVTSENVMVCQIGTGQSLIENFGLASKIDPTAFSSFRLPAVVGGANMNLTEILRATQQEDPTAFASLLNDFSEILNRGVSTGLDGLKSLKIVTEVDGQIIINEDALKSFLISENVPAISKAATGFLENMMSQDVAVYNKILTMQNQYFTGLDTSAEGFTGEANYRLPGSKFYGNVLSTFLRTATLTIHGTTGLNVFNLIYLKGLLSGVEGLYLISSVNESIAAANFTTTLECKLVEYINNDDKTNPLAYRGRSDLRRLEEIIKQQEKDKDLEFGVDYTIEDLDNFIERTDNAQFGRTV